MDSKHAAMATSCLLNSLWRVGPEGDHHARRQLGIFFGPAGDWKKKKKIKTDIKHGSLHLFVENLNPCYHPTSHCYFSAPVNNLHTCCFLHFKVCFGSSSLAFGGSCPWGMSHVCDESRDELTVIGSWGSPMLRSPILLWTNLIWITVQNRCLPFELTRRTCLRHQRHRLREALNTSGHCFITITKTGSF